MHAFQGRFSICAQRITLLMLRINRSAMPFAGGQRGVISLWVNPIDLANLANAPEVKERPLSDFTSDGVPNWMNILRKALMVASAVKCRVRIARSFANRYQSVLSCRSLA